MKAVVVARYGAPVEIVDVPEPVLKPRDLRVKVAAASLNPLDYKIRDGKVKLVIRRKPPIVLGCDIAGTVVAVGFEVTGFAVGDEIFARLDKYWMGGLAEYACVDEALAAKKPGTSTMVEAASIPLAGLTALQALRDKIGATPGQRVLIQAGAGGVGSLAIQIGKILGLWVATTTSTKNVELVTSLGADQVVDYKKQNVSVLDELDGVFDSLGPASELESIAVTKRGGIVVGVGGLPDAEFRRQAMPWFTAPAIWAMTAKRRAAAKRHGVTFKYLYMRPDGAELAELATWISQGTLKPLVHQVFPFAQVREAFAELERGHARGKIVVEL
ncbi:MAG TPA: NADP-dependent oxidoreductase [Kofleriaceae bacterium]